MVGGWWGDLTYRLSPIAYRLSPIGYWLLAISYQLSAISYQPSIPSGMGWLLVFATTPPWVIAFAPAALALRLVAYFGWARITRKWPLGG